MDIVFGNFGFAKRREFGSSELVQGLRVLRLSFQDLGLGMWSVGLGSVPKLCGLRPCCEEAMEM